MHSMGIIRQSIQLSWENIKSNKMRTFLTTLGIIIGVTAVISLITIVNGVIATVMNEFASLGAGTISVSISGTPLKRGLTESDLESLEALDNVAGVSPTISSTGMAARNQKLLDSVSIQGKNEVYYAHNSLVTVGRGISEWDVENSAYVCVIDQDIADKLFAGIRNDLYSDRPGGTERRPDGLHVRFWKQLRRNDYHSLYHGKKGDRKQQHQQSGDLCGRHGFYGPAYG